MAWSKNEIESLYRRTRGALHMRCRALLGSDAEAQDLAHEVYLAILENPGAFQAQSSAVSYLFGIATKRALSRLRARYRRGDGWTQAVGSILEATQPSGDPRARTEAKDTLIRVLAEADEETALMVLYHFVDGLSQGEIAELLSLSRVTINQRLSAFRKSALASVEEE